MQNFQEKVSFIWSIAELLRGPYRPENYGDVILPMAVLRRFDAVLSDTKEDVLRENKKYESLPETTRDEILNRVAKQKFNNTSQFDFAKLLSDPDNIADNLRDYINGFSYEAREILSHFNFDNEIDKMDDNNLLYLVVRRFGEIDLHPDQVTNIEMGYIFEELIRRFSEHAEAGDHYTPREVIKLMVHLMFLNDDEILLPSVTRTLYDSCAGTGGMGTVAQDYIRDYNPTGHLEFFAQEINPESYAISKADMLIKGQDARNIKKGNTLSNDHFKNKKFDYMITNPPYGVEWKPAKDAVEAEYNDLGFSGRFGAGLPRIGDGQLLFLQNLVAKMKPVTEQNPNGSRIAIIMNGSPLFTGDAGSGESEIRRYLFENDLVEGIVALPDQLFYNTGISTYIWILTNHKTSYQKGKIQLVNAVDMYQKMRKSLGNKRNEISEEQINTIVEMYGQTKESDNVKIFNNEDFGYYRVTVERPLRLNFQITEERIARLDDERAFANLAKSRKSGEKKEAEIAAGQAQQETIKSVLTEMQSDTVYKNREAFIDRIKAAFKDTDITLRAPLLKAIWAALSERDETADACMKNKKDVEPDPELRDTEIIPLSDDIEAYFEREVLPHVTDAWIDEEKTRIGYEIPFTRYFYKYTKLRPSSEIKAEIQELEESILEKLKKVMA
ncbi:Site-specific DNA-methyltransferase (adenine-specific) [Lentibacillus sp. JNUCC-1]|uniref:type I restriction-modification system subunit M n=1 Tax=Lentibacillus sp. JNUCC-1 TaxID=2654513 RepID=UPI0012E7F1C6|nr:class I SAM-dependent DNA methyltransferase [Lentibacillus sp. JNUCC-1]MUV37809.1 Site-specific DNA-methyltransferase (adenine-specific) [Lentibacillus sp. JNUCC-1]